MTAAAAPALSRISLKWGMVEEPGLSVLDTFLLLADLGYDGVELDAPGELDKAEVIAARDRSGLAIPGVICSTHWKLPLTSPDRETREAGVAGVLQAIDDAAEYGATTVLVVPGVVDATTSYARAYELAVEGVSRVLERAEAKGISVAIENVWNNFLLSPLEAVRFVDGFKSSRVGWYFDVGNILRYGRPAHWIEALSSRILKIDIKEYSIERMNSLGPWAGFQVELGEGDNDWPAVNAALRGVGYSGWGSAEVPGGGRARLADILARTRRLAGA
jgi:hexulose-6-phosphate isomerase